MDIPAPDIAATVIPVGDLTGTAASIAASAARAGYHVRASRALGPRVPRQPSQAIERQQLVTVAGTMHGWGFKAHYTARDGWDVIQYRPGWPATPSDIAELRATLKAQTPTDLGKVA